MAAPRAQAATTGVANRGGSRVSPKQEQVERLLAAHLYVITPDAEPDVVVEIAAAAARGRADVIQLRHKTLARGALLALARRLREITAQAGILFIVNDHVDLALLSDADGVHLGPDDLSIQSARQVAGDRLLIGASASNPQQARAAIADGADHLGCGPAFTTPIKTSKQVIGPEGVAAIAAAVGPQVPVFAIGGIDETNVAQVVAAGLRRVCVIRAVSSAPDPEQAVRRLRAMLTER